MSNKFSFHYTEYICGLRTNLLENFRSTLLQNSLQLLSVEKVSKMFKNIPKIEKTRKPLRLQIPFFHQVQKMVSRYFNARLQNIVVYVHKQGMWAALQHLKCILEWARVAFLLLWQFFFWVEGRWNKHIIVWGAKMSRNKHCFFTFFCQESLRIVIARNKCRLMYKPWMSSVECLQNFLMYFLSLFSSKAPDFKFSHY